MIDSKEETIATILVTGGRHFEDREYVYTALDYTRAEYEKEGLVVRVIHGGSTGADELANDWCVENGVEVKVYPALWGKYGMAGGPIRNQEMVDTRPDMVIVFPGGSGTNDCAKKARSAKLTIADLRDKYEKDNIYRRKMMEN